MHSDRFLPEDQDVGVGQGSASYGRPLSQQETHSLQSLKYLHPGSLQKNIY